MRTFGIYIVGKAEVFCDIQSVVKNSRIPTSTLNKLHNEICYHHVREAQVDEII